MGVARDIWNGLDWSVLTNMLLRIIPAFVCITLHELAHGLVAYRLGDNTAKDAGRLTLNPIRHLDIMGLLSMMLFGFGWAKPVPVNMANFKKPKHGMALTALAGPVTNLLITAVALFLYGFFLSTFWPALSAGRGIGYYVAQTLLQTAYLSIAFAIFNFLPLPPLDGSKVLFSVLPDGLYLKLMYYERYGMIFLFLLLFLMNNSGVNPLGTVAYYVFNKLSFFADWGLGLHGLIF